MTSDENEPSHESARLADDLPPKAEVWLVDGYNVLHAIVLGGEPRGRFWQRDSRARLIERLAARADTTVEIVLVFDGKHPVEGDDAHPAPGLEVVFAPSADDWIVRRVRESERAERIGVVTHDRQVSGRCRHAGAIVRAPGNFLAALPRAEPPGDPGSGRGNDDEA